MAKPDSIRKFDFLYIGSVVLGLIALALGWDVVMAQMSADMAGQGVSPEGDFAIGAVVVGVVLGTGLNLALWFLISVLRIEFVKWLLILLILWGMLSFAAGPAVTSPNIVQIVGIVSTIMSIAAVYFLFQPDAKEWFAAKRGD